MAINFKALAQLVLDDVIESGLAERLRPTLEQVEGGLKRLNEDRFMPDETVAGKKGKPLLTAVRAAVELAQKSAGGGLTVDKLFGMSTLSWLEFGLRCLGKARDEWRTDPDYRAENAIPDTARFKKLEIRYFIQDLPVILSSNPRRILEQAWQSWMLVCGLTATECDKIEDANVVVTVQEIDGRSNILADAHVGPPERTRLQLRFDKAEMFDEFRFEATAAHEIGHLLGLSHSTTPGQLMNASLGQIKSPQSEDAELAVAEWGPRPTAAPVIPDPVVARVKVPSANASS